MKTFNKDNSFIVKGFAIILLLIYHLFSNSYMNIALEVDYRPFPSSVFLTFTDFGNICVSIFVFMTAFGISTKLFLLPELNAHKAYADATKRLFTLMMNFFLLYLSVNLLWGNKFDYAAAYGTGKQGVLNLLLDAFGLYNLTGTPTINITWWYMKIAYLLIFIIPLWVMITKQIGYPVLILSLMAPILIPIDGDIKRYLFTMTLGVCAAYGKWPEKIMNLNCSLSLQWAVGIAGFVFCVILRQNQFIQENYLHLVDGGVCLFLIYFAGILLASVPLLKDILAFIGKHSLNIYLVHTFFYLLLWQKYIYAFKYAGITLLILLGACLIYSVLLEHIKKWGKKIITEKFHKVA